MAEAGPFVAAPMAVEDAWIDYNGHLNMAYYNVLFDRGSDGLFDKLGISTACAGAANGRTESMDCSMTPPIKVECKGQGG